MALHARLLLGTAIHLFSLPWWGLSLEGDPCQSQALLKERLWPWGSADSQSVALPLQLEPCVLSHTQGHI